ncbi:MAG: immunity 17 family protein [Bacteroidales bacterium]
MQTANIFVSILFLIIGTLSLMAGIMNWNWFYRSHNVSIAVRWFGRSGARFFYGTIGVIVIVMGILMLSGVID